MRESYVILLIKKGTRKLPVYLRRGSIESVTLDGGNYFVRTTTGVEYQLAGEEWANRIAGVLTKSDFLVGVGRE